MRIYSFNWATGEYTGQDEADQDPLDPGNFIIPAYATTKAPPELESNQRAVFDREKDDWTVDNGPEPEPKTFTEHFKEVPANLLGFETIGDLFDGQ